jgi:manganese oxidase
MKLNRWNIMGFLAFVTFVIGWSNVARARVITADVIAFDQPQVYNRFGANNPYGIMYALRRDVEPIPPASTLTACNVRLKGTKRPRPLVLRGNVGDSLSVTFTNNLCSTAPGAGTNRPITRIATMTAAGLTVTGATTDPVHVGISGIAPGSSHIYTWNLEREGTYLIFDNGAPAGGEGDGGSVVLGLFGAINVEPAGSVWHRSQVTAAELAAATNSTTGVITYTSFAMLDASNQIISSDLNAIISGFSEANDNVLATTEGNFREFTVIFHDEIKAIQAYAELNNVQMHGVRDGFAINYGSQGMGPALLANRAGTGPNAACIECAFEEMSLSSWANGDPSLLVQYPADPSNVHHSYLGDRVKFRNLHAGPKETHVFHLHAHQWLAQTDGTNSTYLDSQSIGPRQGYTYEITYGGSGNRNKTVGDSIFHCHLYPHFVQGMWELWRTHDVYEDGTRKLPDGVLGVGTSPTTGITTGAHPSRQLFRFRGRRCHLNLLIIPLTQSASLITSRATHFLLPVKQATEHHNLPWIWSPPVGCQGTSLSAVLERWQPAARQMISQHT